MRNYIYINNDLVSAYLAQIDKKGIANSHILSEDSTHSMEKGKSIQDKSTEKTMGTENKIFTAVNTIKSEIEVLSQSSTVLETSKRDTSFKVHTINNFEKLTGFADDFKLVQVEDAYEYYDLVNLFEVAKFVLDDHYNMFLEQENYEKFSKVWDEDTNRSDKRNNKNNKNNFIKQKINEEKENMKAGITSIEFLMKILPTSIYLENKDFIVPLEKRYFLYNSSIIDYLFRDNTTVMGYVGPQLIAPISHKELTENVFKNVNTSMKNVYSSHLTNLGFSTNKKLLIPIAWYQE